MDSIFSPYLERIEQEIDIALPKKQGSEWASFAFGTEFDGVTDGHWQPLVEPTRELISLGGKRWRPLFLVLCAEACAKNGQAPDTAYSLTPLVEFVHTASLIHDDIEDSSDSRRGKPAAYLTYGLDTAINAGSWLYFEAASCIDRVNTSEENKLLLYRTYALELRRLHLGQAMDIAWHRDASFCPTAAEYIAMVRNKTGTLASLAAKVGTLAAGADAETSAKAGETASLVGAGFQVIDDVINLTSGNPGKKRGDDIVEGKKSLPVLLFAEKYGVSSSEYQELENCFKLARKDGIESPAVEKAVSLLTDSECVAEARKRGIDYIDKACSSFKELFRNNSETAEKICRLFYSMIPAIL